MPKINIVYCTYSYGLGNGIAHVDNMIIDNYNRDIFDVKPFVIRYDLPKGKVYDEHGFTHVNVHDAINIIEIVSKNANIVQVNGSTDAIAANAAIKAGVPGIIEVLHNAEPGALSKFIDKVVCVSPFVQSNQYRTNTIVIPNGIDCDKFSFKPKRRNPNLISVVQIANEAKKIDIELSLAMKFINDPNVIPYMVGSRKKVVDIKNLGIRHDMPRIYHEMDLLFLIEQRSAFGLVFAEGMACGTLPIISVNSGATSFVEHNETGWIVDPKDKKYCIDVFKEAIETVKTSKFETMQKKAREVIESQYSIKNMIKQYENLWLEYGSKPRRESIEPGSWMNLLLFTILFSNSSPYFTYYLDSFLNDPRPLEKDFIEHPVGNSFLGLVISQIIPLFINMNKKEYILRLIDKLIKSNCYSPVLYEMREKATR